jgi:hypothetical protein
LGRALRRLGTRWRLLTARWWLAAALRECHRGEQQQECGNGDELLHTDGTSFGDLRTTGSKPYHYTG